MFELASHYLITAIAFILLVTIAFMIIGGFIQAAQQGFKNPPIPEDRRRHKWRQ